MKRRRGKMKKLISGLIVLVMITAFMTGSVFAAAPGAPTESFDADTRASGITYGPWFGNGNESWSTDIKSLASATSTITGAISFCLPPSAARSIGGEISGALSAIAIAWPDCYTYGTVQKEYREAHYSDGTFAYFQSHYTVKAYAVSNGKTTYLGTFHEYYEGSYPMRLQGSESIEL